MRTVSRSAVILIAVVMLVVSCAPDAPPIVGSPTSGVATIKASTQTYEASFRGCGLYQAQLAVSFSGLEPTANYLGYEVSLDSGVDGGGRLYEGTVSGTLAFTVLTLPIGLGGPQCFTVRMFAFGDEPGETTPFNFYATW